LIGVVVDAASGANFEYPAEVRLDLAPISPPAAPVAEVPITPTTVSLPASSEAPSMGSKRTRM
jgi:hypothetical protein